MPEKEKPPAMRVDNYYADDETMSELARDLGDRLQSWNASSGASGDYFRGLPARKDGLL